jgi:hypothetical protein
MLQRFDGLAGRQSTVTVMSSATAGEGIAKEPRRRKIRPITSLQGKKQLPQCFLEGPSPNLKPAGSLKPKELNSRAFLTRASGMHKPPTLVKGSAIKRISSAHPTQSAKDATPEVPMAVTPQPPATKSHALLEYSLTVNSKK